MRANGGPGECQSTHLNSLTACHAQSDYRQHMLPTWSSARALLIPCHVEINFTLPVAVVQQHSRPHVLARHQGFLHRTCDVASADRRQQLDVRDQCDEQHRSCTTKLSSRFIWEPCFARAC